MPTNKYKQWGLLALVALACLPTVCARADSLHSASHYTQIARAVAEGLPRAHLTHQSFGDTIAERALENFLSALNYDRTIFLADDVRSFHEEVLSLDDKVRKGNVDFPYRVFDVFKERASNRVAYVEKLLADGFDLEKDETYSLERKDASWPETEDEWNDLWRRKIKNEYVGRLVNRALKEEKASREAAEKEKSGESKEEDKGEVKGEGEKIAPKTPQENILKNYEQFMTVLNGHDAEWVLQLYLNSFTRAFDSHSAYHSPRASEDFEIQMKLSLTGIGALLSPEDGAAKIVRLIPGGPAETDGRLQAGDKIIAVAQGDEEPVDIMHWPLYKSVRLIRGEIGTKVVLSVIPASDVTGTSVEKIDIIREVIKLQEREAKSRVREVPSEKDEHVLKLGVLRLPDFYADQRGLKNGDTDATSSSRDVKRLLMELKDDEVDGVLLDLRNNGGGSLPDAIEMTGHFIEKGPVVQVKANRRIKVYRDPNKDTVYDGPLVILVNRQSASASEILAAALQDHGRAIVVGDSKTHGKGSVQSVFPLSPGNPKFGSLKITTAGFYRIDGRTTQLNGVTPDIVVPSTMDVMEIGEEYLSNVLTLSEISAAKYKANDALKAVVPLLRKNSEERRRANPRFEAYAQLMNRLEEKTSMTEISLHLENRIEMARKDRELDDMQKAFYDDNDEDEDVAEEEEEVVDEGAESTEKVAKKDRKDIILTEALFILRDLVENRPQPTMNASVL